MIALGWTSSEHLVAILKDGSMAVYNIHGQQQYSRIITRVCGVPLGYGVCGTIGVWGVWDTTGVCEVPLGYGVSPYVVPLGYGVCGVPLGYGPLGYMGHH